MTVANALESSAIENKNCFKYEMVPFVLVKFVEIVFFIWIRWIEKRHTNSNSIEIEEFVLQRRARVCALHPPVNKQFQARHSIVQFLCVPFIGHSE